MNDTEYKMGSKLENGDRIYSPTYGVFEIVSVREAFGGALIADTDRGEIRIVAGALYAMR